MLLKPCSDDQISARPYGCGEGELIVHTGPQDEKEAEIERMSDPSMEAADMERLLGSRVLRIFFRHIYLLQTREKAEVIVG